MVSFGMRRFQKKLLWNIVFLSILSVLYVSTSVCYYTSMKILMSQINIRYQFFFSQVFNVLYVPQSVVLFWLLWWAGAVRMDNFSSSASSGKRFSHRYCVVIAVVDSVAFLMVALGNAGTPGSLQIILQQVRLPVVVVLSLIFLAKRYNLISYVACVIIIIGVSLKSLVSAIYWEDFNGIVWYSCVISLFGDILWALTSLLKEFFMKRSKAIIDPMRLAVVVGIYSLPISFVLGTITTIPGFGGQPFSSLTPNFWEGFLCAIGIDSYVKDHCVSAWVPMVVMVISGFWFGILGFYVVKVGSAVIFNLLNAVRVPIGVLVFNLPFIVGAKNAEKFSYLSGISVGLVCLGVLLYVFGDSDVWKSDERFGKSLDPRDRDTSVNK